MDNNTLAITVSAGAIGATLAYLGYNNYLNRDEEDETTNDDVVQDTDTTDNEKMEKTARTSPRAGSDVSSPQNVVVSKKSPVGDTEQEKAKQEVKEEVQTKQKEVKSDWGQFWAGEYDAQRNNAKASQEVQAGDYN